MAVASLAVRHCMWVSGSQNRGSKNAGETVTSIPTKHLPAISNGQFLRPMRAGIDYICRFGVDHLCQLYGVLHKQSCPQIIYIYLGSGDNAKTTSYFCRTTSLQVLPFAFCDLDTKRGPPSEYCISSGISNRISPSLAQGLCERRSSGPGSRLGFCTPAE